MGTKLFVGGLAWAVGDDDLRDAFASCGEVVEARVITDRDTGRSRGFGFVTMADDAGAQAAVRAMDGADLKGRRMKVNEAEERRGGGGGGGRSGPPRDAGPRGPSRYGDRGPRSSGPPGDRGPRSDSRYGGPPPRSAPPPRRDEDRGFGGNEDPGGDAGEGGWRQERRPPREDRRSSSWSPEPRSDWNSSAPAFAPPPEDDWGEDRERRDPSRKKKSKKKDPHERRRRGFDDDDDYGGDW